MSHSTKRFNLTKNFIENIKLPSPGARPEYRDSEVKGLLLRCTPTGVKSWNVLLWNNKTGKPDRISLGKYPEVSPQHARTRALQLLGDHARGVNPAEAARKERSRMVFSALFADYYEHHAVKHKRSHREDKQKYERHLSKRFGNRPIDEITRADIADIHRKITGTGPTATPTAANRVYALLGSIFSHAVRMGYLETSPVSGLRKNPENRRRRFIQSHEVAPFMRALNAETNTTVRDLIHACLFTGPRSGNVMAMRWDQLKGPDGLHLFGKSPNSNVVSFPGTSSDCYGVWEIPMTKNGEPQQVPLSSHAYNVLAKRYEDLESAEWVFPGSGKAGHLREPKAGWLRITSRAEGYALLSNHPALVHSLEAKSPDIWHDLIERPVQALQAINAEAADLKLPTRTERLTDLHIHDLRRTLATWMANTGANDVMRAKVLGHKLQGVNGVYSLIENAPVRKAVQMALDTFLQQADTTALQREQRPVSVALSG